MERDSNKYVNVYNKSPLLILDWNNLKLEYALWILLAKPPRAGFVAGYQGAGIVIIQHVMKYAT